MHVSDNKSSTKEIYSIPHYYFQMRNKHIDELFDWKKTSNVNVHTHTAKKYKILIQSTLLEYKHQFLMQAESPLT